MVARTSIALLVLGLVSASTQQAIAGGRPSATKDHPVIAFMRIDPSSMQVRSRVFLMNVNGSERRALTARPVYGGVGYAPYSWSPDRRYLLLPVPAPRGATTLW